MRSGQRQGTGQDFSCVHSVPLMEVSGVTRRGTFCVCLVDFLVSYIFACGGLLLREDNNVAQCELLYGNYDERRSSCRSGRSNGCIARLFRVFLVSFWISSSAQGQEGADFRVWSDPSEAPKVSARVR